MNILALELKIEIEEQPGGQLYMACEETYVL